MSLREGQSTTQPRKTDRDGSKHFPFDNYPEHLKASKTSSPRRSAATVKTVADKVAEATSKVAVKAATTTVERMKSDSKDNDDESMRGTGTNNSQNYSVHALQKEQPKAPFNNDGLMDHGKPAFVAKVKKNAGPPVPPKVPIGILKNEEVQALRVRPPKPPVGVMKVEEAPVPPVRPPGTPVIILDKEETPVLPDRPPKFS